MGVRKSIDLKFTGKCTVIVHNGMVRSVWLKGRSDRGTQDHTFRINWTEWLAVAELVERERVADIERMKTELKQLEDEKWKWELEREHEPATSV